VVTDQQMPEMTGCELCERLRQDERYREIPIIMLTAKGLELELPRLRDELGITATFLKPFSPNEIVQAVEDCLVAVSS
jgi:CheY-like chemotaxis protein